MKIIINCLILLLYNHAHSQNVRILDRNTDQPIPFVTAIFIANASETSGMYADEKGMLQLPVNLVYNTIKLTSLGFQDVYVNKQNITSTIYMTSRPVKLEEVEINFTRRLKDTILGEYNIKKDRKMPLGVQNQMAVFFENPFEDEVPLKELRLKVHKVKYKTAIRIHLYCRYDYVQRLYITGDPDKKFVPHDSFIPGDEITSRDIITFLFPGDKELKINLSDYNIVLPYDGIFAGIECLGYFDDEDNPITIESKNFSQLEYHQTVLDNFCIKHKLETAFWINHNKHMKADTFMMGITLDEDQFQAPTMGLVVSK